eukprot:2473252-Rhodomonas_salina.1
MQSPVPTSTMLLPGPQQNRPGPQGRGLEVGQIPPGPTSLLHPCYAMPGTRIQRTPIVLRVASQAY